MSTVVTPAAISNILNNRPLLVMFMFAEPPLPAAAIAPVVVAGTDPAVNGSTEGPKAGTSDGDGGVSDPEPWSLGSGGENEGGFMTGSPRVVGALVGKGEDGSGSEGLGRDEEGDEVEGIGEVVGVAAASKLDDTEVYSEDNVASASGVPTAVAYKYVV